MKRRYSIAVTRRRYSIHVLEERNRISPAIDYDDDIDFYDLETEFVLAKMRTMSPEEASAYAAQAVAEAELAVVEAAEAVREAEAAEAEAQAATAQAAATIAARFKKMQARNARKMKPHSEESGTRVGQLEEPPSE